MKHHHTRLHLHIGLRAFKTALAVTIALLITRLLDTYSPIFAGLGAIVVMARTLQDSLQEARTQFVGLVLGALVGFLLLAIDPAPSPWITGAGVLAVIVLCSLLHLYYAASLAAIIVLSVCVSTDGNVMAAMCYRLLDTSIGLVVGGLVNMVVKPYNNRHRVVSLLYKLAGSVPSFLDTCILQNLYPDLTEYEKNLRTLEVEFEIYHKQHFRYREAHEQDAAYLKGVCQLASRIYQELSALSCMDTFGQPSRENLNRLRELGLCAPSHLDRKCTEEDSIVTNYHLEKVLDAREYLLELLQ